MRDRLIPVLRYQNVTYCGMIWYDMIYDMIWYISLTAIGLTPGGSSTVHIYTQTIHRTNTETEHTEQNIYNNKNT
jgi:hypothetical protein